MEEQTIQQPQNSTYDASADGVAYSGFDDEPSQQSTEELETAELEQAQDDNGLPSDGISVKDGELEYGDDFFGDIGKNDNDDVDQQAQAQENEQDNKNSAPYWYKIEDLKSIPYEQWDVSRLHGDIKDFVPIVQEQIRARNSQIAAQQVAENAQNTSLPDFIVEPKQYTPKELAQAARTLACEKLGLSDPDDYDDMDMEHQAAYKMASDEIMHKYWSDSQAYEYAKSEWQKLMKFNAEFDTSPDFNQFNQWFLASLQARGVTPQQVSDYLLNLARENGNNFGIIAQAKLNMYREFQQFRAAAQNQKQASQKTRVKPPAKLESSGGNNAGMQRHFDMSRFGELDADAQAEALVNMGII